MSSSTKYKSSLQSLEYGAKRTQKPQTITRIVLINEQKWQLVHLTELFANKPLQKKQFEQPEN